VVVLIKRGWVSQIPGVADPGCLFRIRLFLIPDPNFSQPGSMIQFCSNSGLQIQGSGSERTNYGFDRCSAENHAEIDNKERERIIKHWKEDAAVVMENEMEPTDNLSFML
jgi:hypothetical protein